MGKLCEEYFASRYVLLSVSDSIDTRCAAGRLVVNVLTSVAQWEREIIGERTKEALAHLKTKGIRLGSEALGWRRVEDADAEGRYRVEPVHDERQTIELIRSLHAEGLSLRAICEVLTVKRRSTKRGGRWSPAVVRSILRRSAVQSQIEMAHGSTG
jgi:DNA invertase Pin-like site-specific DNA recombinase